MIKKHIYDINLDMSDTTTQELSPRSKFLVELAASVATREHDPADVPDAEFRQLGEGWAVVGPAAVTSLIGEAYFLTKILSEDAYRKSYAAESSRRNELLADLDSIIKESGLYNYTKYKIMQSALKPFHANERSGLPKGYLINTIQNPSVSPEGTMALLAVTLRHRLYINDRESPQWPSWDEIWNAVQAGPCVYPAISSGLADMRGELQDTRSVNHRLKDVYKITRYTAAAIHENRSREARQHGLGRKALKLARRVIK